MTYIIPRQEEHRLGAAPLALIMSLLPAVPSVVSFVSGLFTKKKPTLTEAQTAALSRLPEPYLSMAVSELESVNDMRASFSRVFQKYANRYLEDQKAEALAKANAENKAKQDKQRNTVIIASILGGVAVVGLTALIVIVRNRKK